ANNYEEVDENHPVIEQFSSSSAALEVFRRGFAMSKGTTTSTGLVQSYFTNIFGPPQYRALHDQLAEQFFNAFFQNRTFVGQLRTRLGLPGWEQKGPQEAAKALLQKLQDVA
ncbi:MAG: phosphoenolpyruvate carboxykinase, partial [Candidatus Kryptoniota bacterium]